MEESWTEGGSWTGDSWTGLLDGRTLDSAAGRKKALCRSEQANDETKLLELDRVAGRAGESWTGLLDGREMDRAAAG